MPNLSNEIVQFAAGDTTFFEAFQDYYFHYNKVNQKRDLGGYDASVSLSEKSEKVHNAFFAEVEKRSGVSRSGNENSWAAHPNVRWASMSVIDATINSILPATINPTMGLYTDLRFVGYGDIVKFRIKPRSLYTVSLGNYRPAC